MRSEKGLATVLKRIGNGVVVWGGGGGGGPEKHL